MNGHLTGFCRDHLFLPRCHLPPIICWERPRGLGVQTRDFIKLSVLSFRYIPLVHSCESFVFVLLCCIVPEMFAMVPPGSAALIRVQSVMFIFSLPLVVAAAVSSGWHPPNATNTNDLKFAVSGDGTNGFIYDSSSTPDGEYGIYNYCNMPHVRAREYVIPDQKSYKLEYVEVIQRHHKRTPYQSNTFPIEDRRWDCGDSRQFYYGEPATGFGAARVFVCHNTYYRPFGDYMNSMIG